MQQRPKGYGTSIGGGGAHHLPNGITTDICELRIIARKKNTVNIIQGKQKKLLFDRLLNL